MSALNRSVIGVSLRAKEGSPIQGNGGHNAHEHDDAEEPE